VAVKVCDGLREVLVPPSPKSHAHDVAPPVEVSVNETTSGTVPEVDVDVNDAVGAVGRLTTTVVLADVEPPRLVAVRVTV
jgi:hypothetical protein